MSSSVNEFLSENEVENIFLNKYFLIDVRSELEFVESPSPYSVNLPILNNIERAQVGTCYKQQGREAALKLGHQIVSGQTKEERIQKWLEAIKQNPDKTVFTCFRGGLRSQIAQQWCTEAGVLRPRIKGGTKWLRQKLRESFDFNFLNKSWIVISGPTGSGKTELIHQFSNHSLNLESLAQHRGSAFGGFDDLQPNQSFFESNLACQIYKLKHQSCRKILVEDESRMIGKLVIPTGLFQTYREAPIVFCDEPLFLRAQRTLQEYVVEPLKKKGHLPENIKMHFNKLCTQTLQIQKKLGGQRTQEILTLIQNSEVLYLKNQTTDCNLEWIEKLLSWYYDPIYLNNIEKRRPQILFRGTQKEVYDYLETESKGS